MHAHPAGFEHAVDFAPGAWLVRDMLEDLVAENKIQARVRKRNLSRRLDVKPLPVGRIPKLEIVEYIVANRGFIARIEKLVDSPAGATAIVENSRALWDLDAFGLTEGDLTNIWHGKRTWISRSCASLYYTDASRPTACARCASADTSIRRGARIRESRSWNCVEGPLSYSLGRRGRTGAAHRIIRTLRGAAGTTDGLGPTRPHAGMFSASALGPAGLKLKVGFLWETKLANCVPSVHLLAGSSLLLRSSAGCAARKSASDV